MEIDKKKKKKKNFRKIQIKLTGEKKGEKKKKT
jgi:hypothetical protein